MTTPTPESVKALADLADRVESATGPDRELDAAIATALGWTDVRYNRAHGGYWEHDPDDEFEVRRPVPEWTASIDAAMTLVDGHGVLMHLSDIGADGLPLARVGVPGPDDAPIFTGIASCIMTKTAPVAGLALALTAAALRARAHLGASHA